MAALMKFINQIRREIVYICHFILAKFIKIVQFALEQYFDYIIRFNMYFFENFDPNRRNWRIKKGTHFIIVDNQMGKEINAIYAIVATLEANFVLSQ